MTLRVLIADDEPLARESLRSMLSAEADVHVVGEFGDGDSALAGVRRLAPDLVFLDIDMPARDGIAVVRALAAEGGPPVIFVTAHPRHAPEAWEVRALDYLVKPFGLERFREAFHRARALIREGRQREESAELIDLIDELRDDQRRADRLLEGRERRYLERFTVKSGKRVLFLRAEEIDWFEAAGNYVRLHRGAEGYLIRETMQALEQNLDPSRFLRIHRSTIVNLDRVKELHPWFAGDYLVFLQDGTELKLSRSYRAQLGSLVL
jgi:two-component system LytT family response regulator